MSRWHFATTRELHASATRVCDYAGLRSCGEAATGEVHLRSYSKRAIQNTNFLTLGNTEWICVAGTAMIDSKLGADALPAFYERFAEGGVGAARDAVTGHYAACIRRGDVVTAFTDEQASIPLFYGSVSGQEHVLTNSLHVAGSVLGVTDYDVNRLLLSCFRGEMGEDTFLRGVKRLSGARVLEIDLPTRGLRVKRVVVRDASLPPEECTSIESAVHAYAARVRGVFAQIAAQPSLGLHATGGLDTRTVLAALLDAGAQPLLMFGVGNSILTGTMTHDLKVVEQLARSLGLPHYVMDWAGSQPHSPAVLSDLTRQYGFLRRYGMSEGVLREFLGGIDPYPTLHIGGYGIAQKARAWGQQAKRGLDELTTEMSPLERQIMTPEGYQDYWFGMRSAIDYELEEMELEGAGEELSPSQYVRAQFIVRRSIELRAAMFFNEFAHYLTPLWTKWLNDPFFTCPAGYQADGEFQLRLIHELAPRVLDVPICSGDMARSLGANRLHLKRPRLPRLWRVRRAVLSRVLPLHRRQAVVSRLGINLIPWLPGASVDTRKDARTSDLVRRDLLQNMRWGYPLVVKVFTNLRRVPVGRLYDFYWRLQAIRSMEEQDGAS